eukprot:COSAG03_NODE_346_length_8784_cov_37.126540_5_plen_85_part_00
MGAGGRAAAQAPLLVLAGADRFSAGHAGQTRPTGAWSQREGEGAGEKEREKARQRDRDREKERERCRGHGARSERPPAAAERRR